MRFIQKLIPVRHGGAVPQNRFLIPSFGIGDIPNLRRVFPMFPVSANVPVVAQIPVQVFETLALFHFISLHHSVSLPPLISHNSGNHQHFLMMQNSTKISCS